MTVIPDQLKSAIQAFANGLRSQSSSILLRLTLPQQTLLAAVISENNPVFFLTNESLKKSQQVWEMINTWTDLVHSNTQWSFIVDELTPPERSGAISTPTSLAFHALLFYGYKPGYSFVITEQALQKDLPNLQEYQSLITTFTKGETIDDLSSVVKTLSEHGFVRHTTSVEVGTMRVRGDQLDIAHPLLPGYYSIVFHNRTIERLTHYENQRSRILSHLKIPPMRFPEKNNTWKDILSQKTLLRPSVLSLTGSPTIIYDSLQSTLEMPWQEEWLSLLPAPTLPTDLPVSVEAAYELLGRLTAGKPAVHRDHGVGIYEGLHSRKIDQQEREYLVLRYAEGDTLSIPVEFAHKVTPYIGDSTPSLHRLGGTLWSKSRKAATAEALRLAQELLRLARERNAHSRSSYSLESNLEDLLNTTCPFELTEGQRTAWDDVRRDLEQLQPMDRLIVGDVGFGKTEIAQRAAAHAVHNGKQVAIIAPTTLLVQQHADTFKERLVHLKDKIGLLSRFISPKDQKTVKKGLEDGSVMIVIGTHALLNKNIHWKNLGLVIIDEEQRFGVKQKEHFKQLRSTIDILSLSATPIPRTLSMALTGLRQLSVINTPPPDRKSVETTVTAEDKKLVEQAMIRELGRKGQVYVVAPKISHLGSLAHHIKEIIPQARIAIAHGQMDSKQLADIMERFDTHQVDILVSSSIIENGLDLPNANTMIVYHAPHFGLSDLYQLRGRVGRRKRQGYALFLYPDRPLSSIQRQRLTALIEASRLGSGWDIARHDLEIRGAGNLLGAEQSGSVNTVGLQLYLDMVHEASAKESTGLSRYDVDIELPLPVLLPAEYISDLKERTQWYTRLSRAESITKLQELFTTLQKNYGPVPESAQNLKRILTLQHVAAQTGIHRIAAELIKPPNDDPYHRLSLKASDLPLVLARVGELGNWSVRQDSLTMRVYSFTPHLIERLVELLSKNG